MSQQSPKLALEDISSQASDIWALGCIVYELLQGSPLFLDDLLFATPEARVDQPMLLFSETLGPLTPTMRKKWKRCSLHFDNEGRRTEKIPDQRMGDQGGSEESEEHSDDENSDSDKPLKGAVLEAIVKALLASKTPPSTSDSGDTSAYRCFWKI